MKRDESLNRLEKDADSESEEKDAIEECTQKLGSLPAKGEAFRGRWALGDLGIGKLCGELGNKEPCSYFESSQSDNKTDEVVHLVACKHRPCLIRGVSNSNLHSEMHPQREPVNAYKTQLDVCEPQKIEYSHEQLTRDLGSEKQE